MIDQRNNILVSVIIAFLNEEQFLAEAIESVIDQQYDNWELILVDDGSSDNSTSIAKRYVELFNGKIIYCEHARHENKGLSASRNHGISLAGGSLFAFLDADDVWLTEKLQLQVYKMIEDPAISMICEASLYWYSWQDSNISDEIILVGDEQDKVFYPPALLEILYPLATYPAPCPSGIMIRRDVAKKHSGFESHFSGNYQLYEDQAFLHKIYLNEPVFISSNCNNKYRQRKGSLVQAINKKGKYDAVRMYFLKWLQLYMQNHNIKNEHIDQLLENALNKLNEKVPFRVKITRYLWYNHPKIHAATVGNYKKLIDALKEFKNKS